MIRRECDGLLLRRPKITSGCAKMVRQWNAPLRRKIAMNSLAVFTALPNGAAESASHFFSTLAGLRARVEDLRVVEGALAALVSGRIVWRFANGRGERLLAASPSLVAAISERALGRPWGAQGVGETIGLAERLLAAPAIAAFARQIEGCDPEPPYSLIAQAASLSDLDPPPSFKNARVTSFQVSVGGAAIEEIMIAEPLTADKNGREPAKRRSDPNWRRRARASALNAPATVRVVVADLDMSARSLLDMAVGDLVPLPGAATDCVKLTARSGPALFNGRLGVLAGRRAIQLHEAVHHEGELP